MTPDRAQRPVLDLALNDGQSDGPELHLPTHQVGDLRPVPLYGTCLTSAPRASMNISLARWMIVPLPDDAWLY
jgi:hypothetical protein